MGQKCDLCNYYVCTNCHARFTATEIQGYGIDFEYYTPAKMAFGYNRSAPFIDPNTNSIYAIGADFETYFPLKYEAEKGEWFQPMNAFHC